MTRGLRFALALLVSGLPARPAGSQGVHPARTAVESGPQADGLMLTLGDTVRVFGATSVPAEGVLAGVDTTTMLVQLPGMEAKVAMPRAIITRIEVLRGHPHRGVGAVLEGTMLGAIAGGLVSFAVIKPGGAGDMHEFDGLVRFGMSIVGGLVGGTVGLYIAFTRADRWVPVDPQTLVLLETP